MEVKINEYITDYINSLYGNNASKNTTKNYLSDLRFYQNWLNTQNISIIAVNLQLLNKFKVHLRDYKMNNGKHYAPATISKRVTVVKELYNYLHDMDIIEINPATKMTIPDIPKGKTPIYMKADEVKRLITATKDGFHGIRDKAILTVFLTTGLRLSELRELNRGDIDENLLTVLHGKGDKQRKVYINKVCIKAIGDYLIIRFDNNEALFISERGNRISIDSINYMLSKYLKIAKLSEKYTAHKLRHTSASLMLTNGVGIRTIQDILGHASLATTQKYTHVQDEDMQKAANVMESIF